jgi:hypothetical protein
VKTEEIKFSHLLNLQYCNATEDEETEQLRAVSCCCIDAKKVSKRKRKEILKSYKIACLSGDIRQCSLTLIKTTDSR